MRRSALCQTLRDKSEFKGEITQGRFRLRSGSWSHCYTQMLKITQRGKRPVRRCAYLSSISFRVLFRHPHKQIWPRETVWKHQTETTTDWIYIREPPTDRCLLDFAHHFKSKYRRIKTPTCNETTPHASSSSSTQMNQKKIIIEDPSAWITSSSSFVPKGSQSSP